MPSVPNLGSIRPPWSVMAFGDGIKDAPALVRIHTAQEDDIYDALTAA